MSVNLCGVGWAMTDAGAFPRKEEEKKRQVKEYKNKRKKKGNRVVHGGWLA